MYNTYSPNMLKTYQTCPKKFYYQYIEQINMPKSSLPFEKGKKIHALANYYLQKIKIDRIETALNEEEKIIWQKLLNNSYYNKDCLKSEFSLTIKLDKYWVGGRIDAVVFEGNDYYILDYKTGSVPQNPEYDFQTMVYLLCADKYLKEYNSLSFVYIDLKNDKNHIVKFSAEKRTEYQTKIIEACKNIESDTLYKCKKEDCKFCEYIKLCPN